MAKITAVIDIGSNSARMAIFRRTSRFGFHLLYEIKSKVRISEGCYEHNGVLQEVPMQRAINALREFLEVAKAHKARKIFCVATSAIRDAPNSKEFLARVKKECKLAIKVIDGRSEAMYGGIACANLLHTKNGITIDIGGGSTECALIQDGKIIDTISLNVGTIRIKELFFDKNAEIKKAKEFILNEMAKMPEHFKHSVVFGVGGTIRALTRTIMKDEDYPFPRLHGYEFDTKTHKEFFEKIYSAPIHKLESLGVTQDRLDSIRSGVLIFDLFLEHLGANCVITSGVGVREGVFLSDLLRNQHLRFPPDCNPCVTSIQDRFCLEPKFSRLLKVEALRLFDILLPLHKCKEDLRALLGVGAFLSPIGSVLNFYQSNLHGSYILLNGLEYGFSHTQRVIIELLVEFSDRKIPKTAPLLKDFVSKGSIMELQKLQWMSFIIGLTHCIFKTQLPIKARYELNHHTLRIYTSAPLYLAQEGLQKLQKPLSSLEIEIIKE